MRSIPRNHGRRCFASVASLVVVLLASTAWSQEPVSTVPAAPATVTPAASSSPEQAPRSVIDVIWQDRLMTADIANADLNEVMMTLSDKSGIPIELYEGVTGKVTLRLDKLPIEAVVDKVLASVGQRNYLMVSGGDGLKKITIVPKGTGGVVTEAVKKVKARGKLRNGKEIEYYPGEIIVGLHDLAGRRGLLETVGRDFEKKYRLALLGSNRVDITYALRFRILDDRDVLAVMYAILDGREEYVSYVTPNGIGSASVEMPQVDFHVWDATSTEGERQLSKEKKLGAYAAKMQTSPFLRIGYPGAEEQTYVEGEFAISIVEDDRASLTYDAITALANETGSIVFSYGQSSKIDDYILYSPGVRTGAEYLAKLQALRARIHQLRANQFTNAFPRAWIVVNGSPNDEKYVQNMQWNVSRVRAEYTWDQVLSGNPQTVAVIDTGVYWTHPELGPVIWANSGEAPDNGIDDDNNGYVDDVRGWNFKENNNDPSDFDDVSHGTHVAGILGALTNNSGTGIAGVVGNGFPILRAKVLPLTVLFPNIVMLRQAIEYARGKAQVINMSWDWRLQVDLYPTLLNAFNQGAVIVGAAGNSNTRMDSLPNWPEGALDRILVVAGLDSDDRRYDNPVDGSSFGAIVDVSAPGKGIVSTTKDGGYGPLSGTSMATPHVAGLAALLLMKNPGLTNVQVYDLIKSTADPLSDTEMGTGRINMYAALRVAQGFAKDTTPPQIPTNVVLTPGPQTNLLNWSASDEEGIAEGLVYRRFASGSLPCLNQKTFGDGIYCMDGTVRPTTVSEDGKTGAYEYQGLPSNGDKPFYRVVAVDKTGNKSLESSAPVFDTTMPGVPTGLRARTRTQGALLSWGKPSNADGSPMTDPRGYLVSYRWEGNPPGSYTFPMIIPSGLATESLDVTFPSDKGVFMVEVKALDTSGHEGPVARITVNPIRALWVHPDRGQNTYTTISEALINARNGDTVMVGPGTYNENSLVIGTGSATNYLSNDITLMSERGPEETIINAAGSGAFVVQAYDDSRVIGFTIKNSATYGIKLLFDEGVLITNNIFIANEVGVYVGGGFSTALNPVRILNNVFVGNVQAIEGYWNFNGLTEIHNNIFRGNETGLFLERTHNFCVRYNDFYGNALDMDDARGNIFKDNLFTPPSFVDYSPPNGDYHLQSSSAARDAGFPNYRIGNQRWEDCDGTRADMGAYGGPFAYIDNNADGVPDCQNPFARPGEFFVLRNGSVPISLDAGSPAGDPLTYTVETPPTHGTLSGEPGNLTYAPGPNFVGIDSFLYRATGDYSGSSATAPVTINVKTANRTPSASAQTLVIDARNSLNGMLTLQGSDPDGDSLTYAQVDPSGGPAHGYVSFDHPPDVFYFAQGGYIGTDTFRYQVNDGFGNSAPATVTVVVDKVPSIVSCSPVELVVTLNEDGAQVFWVSATDEDIPPQPITYTWWRNGQVVGNTAAYTFNGSSTAAGGNPYALKVVVSDGLASVEHEWTVLVRETVVLDDAACAYSGTWTSATSGSGYLNTGYSVHTAGTGIGYATWSSNLPLPGNYKVYARWQAASTYDVDTVYRVTFAGAKYDEITVDQTGNGGQWNLLGTYYFDGPAQVRLKINSADTGSADGVRFVATDDPADIILDDVAGVPRPSANDWSSLSGGLYGTYRATVAAGSGSRTFTWTPPAMVPGTYEVHAWWKVPTGGASNSKYVVSFGDGRNSQSTVNQTVNGMRWNSLGRYYFAAGDTPSVVLSDNANGVVSADGVKFVWINGEISSIVDNDADADTNPDGQGNPDYFGWSGAWNSRVNYPGYIGADFRMIAAGSGGWAKWVLPISEAGNYELYARWASNTDRSSSAQYEIRHKGLANPEYVVVDQKFNGGVWNYMGRFDFDTATESSVTLRQSPAGVVIADAILFMRTDEALPIILDNSYYETPAGYAWQYGFSIPTSLLPGYWGMNYVQAAPGNGSEANWAPKIGVKGNYDIYARWTAAADRSPNVTYRIQPDAGQSVDVIKNQTGNGGKWVSLGRYYLPEGSGSKVTLYPPATGGTVTVADAVRFDYTATPLPIIIDNADVTPLDYLSVVSGTWTAVTGPLTGFYGTNYLPHAANTGAVVRWTPSLPVRGYYGVYAWWPVANTNFATNAPFRIVHPGAPGGVTRLMNQQINGGKWNYLGTYLFDPGEGGYVELLDSANGKVIADAVKFHPE
jgi:subtilisin family serine protease